MYATKEECQVRTDLRNSGIFEKPGITPVLICYCGDYDVYTYLVPATEDELKLLNRLNGYVGNTNIDRTDFLAEAEDYLNEKLYDSKLHEKGEWAKLYLLDTNYTQEVKNSEGEEEDVTHQLPPVKLPPNTVFIFTGYI